LHLVWDFNLILCCVSHVAPLVVMCNMVWLTTTTRAIVSYLCLPGGVPYFLIYRAMHSSPVATSVDCRCYPVYLAVGAASYYGPPRSE